MANLSRTLLPKNPVLEDTFLVVLGDPGTPGVAAELVLQLKLTKIHMPCFLQATFFKVNVITPISSYNTQVLRKTQLRRRRDNWRPPARHL